MEKINKFFTFTIHNKLFFIIKGSGKIFDYLNFQFNYFKTKDNQGKNFLLHLKKGIDIKNFSSRVKDKNRIYLRKNNKFIIGKNNQWLVFDGLKKINDQKEIIASENISKKDINLFLDLLIRIKILKANLILIHASCVSKKNQAILIPASKKMGKTTLCLKFIENKYNFLSDDKVWINNKGVVFSYPRYIVLKDTNALLFQNFLSKNYIRKLKFKKLLLKKLNFLNNALSVKLINKIIKTQAKYFYIEKIYPRTSIPQKSAISKVIYLEKLNIDKYKLDIINKKQAIRLVTKINNNEWNSDLLKIASVHDVLFQNYPSWRKELFDLLKAEKEILNKSFNKKAIFHLKIPTDDNKLDWNDLVTKTSNI
jgi:hypothetical protein